MEEVEEEVNYIDKFHAHLDACEQCRNHPFDLCPLGAAYLEVAAREGIMEALRPTTKSRPNT